MSLHVDNVVGGMKFNETALVWAGRAELRLVPTSQSHRIPIPCYSSSISQAPPANTTLMPSTYNFITIWLRELLQRELPPSHNYCHTIIYTLGTIVLRLPLAGLLYLCYHLNSVSPNIALIKFKFKLILDYTWDRVSNLRI